MHLIIAFITALASLLYALERLGIDIGWINPWSWRRRRRWLKQYHANPAFNLESPLEVVALLLTATARIDGDISSEEKAVLKQLMETTLKQSPDNASALLRSSTFLLGDGEDVFNRPKEVLERSLPKFSPQQKTSTIDLLSQIAHTGGAPSQAQQNFISRVSALLFDKEKQEEWA